MGDHVSARDDPQERWQGAPVLEHRGESAPGRWAGLAAASVVSGRNQFLAGAGVAQVDRGVRLAHRAVAFAIAVSGRSHRRRPGGRIGGAVVPFATAPVSCSDVGRVLVGAKAVGTVDLRRKLTL